MLLLLTAIGLAVLWLYTKWQKTKKYWADRNVPYIPPHPLLGNLTFLFKLNPGIFMRNIYNPEQPYLGLWWFWRPVLFVNSPELARRVLVKDCAVFKDRFLNSGKKDPIGGLNLFLVNDPLWSSVRKRVSPSFTGAKLRLLHKHFVAKSRELIKRIKIEMESNHCVNLRMMFTDFTTDVVGVTALGVRGDATLTGQSPLRDVTRDFMKFNYLRSLAWTCIFFYPELVDVFGFSFFPKSATNFFRKLFKQIVKERGGYDVGIGQNKDLLDVLRRIKQDCDKNNEEMPEDLLIAQAAAMLQGGFDTTGTALTFCTYELAHSPHWQEIIYNELLEFRDKMINGDVDAEVFQEMPYLNGALKETLRKYMSMGWIDRVASTDYQIDENLTIKAGTPVYVNACGIHYDPQYYPDPEKFDPERFLPENEKNLKPFTYMPFGEGPRFCLGKRFGTQNATCALAHIILNYKIVAKPNSPLPQEVKIEKKSFFYVPGENLYVNFVPRDD
ncbi:PREDICTED: cytochrome P450 6k1-like [Papilio xuthus]|uniref:unspecific monooxygenase n=1 Tax=Papilio xuthus TaxID=66420 RepID=A0AAJ6ZJI7_PAPXU|nr:PREDICTED: cytochrome P450 6k1-like [Papilio xuthus]